MQKHFDHQIVTNAQKFVQNWVTTKSEDSYAKLFWEDFFRIFNIERKEYAHFEYPAPRASNKSGWGKVDLFWYGKLLVEHKSGHLDTEKDWENTLTQANEYFEGILEEDKKNGTKYAPEYIILCNFQRFRIFHFKGKKKSTTYTEIRLIELPEQLDAFKFFTDFVARLYADEKAVNMQAAKEMGFIHQRLVQYKYTGKPLELLMSRILFCLFAEDSGLFSRFQFQHLIENHTNANNFTDILYRLFLVVDTPEEERPNLTALTELKNTNAEIYEALNAFQYVNGQFFREHLEKLPARMSQDLRHTVSNACHLDWFVISPAIFGSLFQGIMDSDERRNKGAHYTSQENILRALNPLFLDKLYAEFLEIKWAGFGANKKIKVDKEKLLAFHEKICRLQFLDPACGSGNFLVIAYNQLRTIELQVFELILQEVDKAKRAEIIDKIKCRVSIQQFHGIEYDDSAAHIGRLSLLIAEHQSNKKAMDTLHIYIPSLPLTKIAPIIQGNALTINWEKKGVVFDYIIGNPPFIGKQMQTDEQKKDISIVFKGIKNTGVLDYVAAWYLRAAQYMKKHPTTETVFVSTNSIAQGEQVGVLWKELYTNYQMNINFAHQTFKWNNEDTDVAAVHCVIISFAAFSRPQKYLFTYKNISLEPQERQVYNINPYLVQGNNVWVEARKKPLCNVPEIQFGSMPNDGGHLLLSKEEKEEIEKIDSIATKYIRPLIGAQEFINKVEKYCLWLVEADPNDILKSKILNNRVKKVKEHREKSNRETTQKLALIPSLFAEIRQPTIPFLTIPRVSSERRRYIPIALFDSTHIVGDTCLFISNTPIHIFGILTSLMHNKWMAYVCGRLESRFRYSNTIVYNNFPFPPNLSPKQEKKIGDLAQIVLDIREKYATSSYATLYNPETMPPDLVKAHTALDKAVDAAYRKEPFKTDTERIEFLFELYRELSEKSEN